MQQEILEKHPESDLKVYAVWFNMVFMDRRAAWSARLMRDPRVAHFWDKDKLLGSWFAANSHYGAGEGVWWDTYLLYDRQSRWDDEPSHLINVGSTILRTRDALTESLIPLMVPAKATR